MTASPNRLTMSVEEYLALDRNSTETRYEYIDGHVTIMAGATLDHATISLNMASTLRGLLCGSSCRVFPSDARVRLSATCYVLPDITVSCDGRDRGRVDIIQYPHLVVEVLSPSTEDYNRGRKFTYYRECPTIQEYVCYARACATIRAATLASSAGRLSRLSRRILHMCDMISLPALEALGGGPNTGPCRCVAHITAVYEDVTLPPADDNIPA